MQAMLKKLKEKNQDEGGFTLIELLVVIVIIGILAGVVVFAVSGITNRGNKSACDATAKTIETAVEAYRAQQGSYPTDIDALDPTFLRLDNVNGTFNGANTVLTMNSGGVITYTASSGAVSDTCT